jgi:ankyrin repeat protein
VDRLLDDVSRLSHVVRDNVDMLGVGLEFVLLQEDGCNREHWDIIKWLMDNTILRDNPLVLKKAFAEACKSNKLGEVRWMIQYRELIRDTLTIRIPLLQACFYGYLAVVKCVVEHNDFDVNTSAMDTLLHHVIWMGESSKLHWVCADEDGDVAEVAQLVYYCGANVNEQDNYDDTPLHLACSIDKEARQRTDIVKALMSCGADVNITNDYKQTPSVWAMLYENKKLLPLLDRASLMDMQLNFVLRKSISVYLTAFFIQNIIDLSILASIRQLFVE